MFKELKQKISIIEEKIRLFISKNIYMSLLMFFSIGYLLKYLVGLNNFDFLNQIIVALTIISLCTITYFLIYFSILYILKNIFLYSKNFSVFIKNKFKKKEN